MQFLEKLWKMREKNRDIKLVTTDRKNYLVLEPSYYFTKFFTEN